MEHHVFLEILGVPKGGLLNKSNILTIYSKSAERLNGTGQAIVRHFAPFQSKFKHSFKFLSAELFRSFF